jgi:hypothetical protein
MEFEQAASQQASGFDLPSSLERDENQGIDHQH